MSRQATTTDAHALEWIAGVDEAGRGPLAGPVVAAAVVLDAARPIAGLADSKTLQPAKRAVLFARLQQSAAAWAIGRAEVEEIDRLNILQATLLAMGRAVASLQCPLGRVFVDGNRSPSLSWPVTCVVRGDQLIPEISAASIMAKVWRDRELECLDLRFPGYGLAAHKGYPTRAHLEALRRLGPSPVHRRSFRPVRESELRAVGERTAER